LTSLGAPIARERHYGGIARDALAIFRADAHARALADVIAFCISRTN
jgi:octaprenyl-diphosphate synthase